MSEIEYKTDADGVDWPLLKKSLVEDKFDNGRTPEQLELSFGNSAHVCFAWDGEKLVGKGRVLSDGVCNAYLVDLWTLSSHRNRGIARRIVEILVNKAAGQHVYLQADDDLVDFYKKLGFFSHPNGMAKVVGNWLQATPPSPSS